uniref:Uncharacterized protein n=1 Tax=Ditylenchus dipsaci TaxID=166011 RepID=A0A915EEX0_9BILA
MDEMRRMQEQRKMQISCALRAIDSPGAAAAMKRKSRKVFKSESEEDEEDTVPKRAKTEEAMPSTLKLVNDDVYKRPVLEKSDPDTFMCKKLFGAFGEEMIKKEMHFADDRFRLDERFIEEDEKQADSDEEQHHKEKLNELSILSRVLGKEVKSSLNTQAPWLKEQQGENTSEDVGISTETTKINDIVKGDLTEATIEGTFYSMDPEFAEELKKKNGKASATEKMVQFSVFDGST